MNDSKKVVLIGAGMVGMSFAYSALNQGLCDELVIIDIDSKKAQGEAMDLNHGLSFSHSAMKISSGDYSDCKDADIAVICAGVNQKPGEDRLSLLGRNKKVFENIMEPLLASGFKGIILVATNPVDIMTQIAQKLSGFPPERVFGTGTTLDTARLRYLLGKYFKVDPRNVHAYVMGEHGDSEFTPWSQALIATKPIEKILETNSSEFSWVDLQKISGEVRDAAQKIISAKGATYYGIGIAISRIVRAILRDEQSVLTISSLLSGEYGRSNIYVGNPCIIGRKGIDRRIELALTEEELGKLQISCDLLSDSITSIGL